MALEIVVYGKPAPGGSKKYMGKSGDGKAIIAPANARTEVWRSNVTQAVGRLMTDWGNPPPLEGKLLVSMVFSFLRPKSVSKTKRPFMTVKPDVSKLCRSTEDALTDAKFWADDCLVGYDRLDKVYCNEDPESLPRPGVWISVRSQVALAIESPGRALLELEAA
jgi:crossover junction endodeoxyribonuclease RusA